MSRVVVFNHRQFYPPRGHLVMPRDIFYLHNCKKTEGRDVAKPTTKLRAALSQEMIRPQGQHSGGWKLQSNLPGSSVHCLSEVERWAEVSRRPTHPRLYGHTVV